MHIYSKIISCTLAFHTFLVLFILPHSPSIFISTPSPPYLLYKPSQLLTAVEVTRGQPTTATSPKPS